MFKFTQITKCQHSVAELIDSQNNNTKKKQINGDLSVFLQISNNMMLLKMGVFQYGINPNDKIVYQDHNPNYKLVLCLDYNNKNYWIIKLNENTQLIKQLLNQRCKLINKTTSKIIVKQIQKQQGKLIRVSSQKMLSSKPNNHNNINNSDSSTDTLIQASKTLSKALIFAGQLIAKSLQSIGQYLSKKIQPSDRLPLSNKSKILIKKSIDQSQKIIKLTFDKFTQIFRISKSQTNKIISQYQNTNHKSENQNYMYYKDKINTGINFVGNVFDGFVEGVTNVGNGIIKGTNQVTQAKYGKSVNSIFNPTNPSEQPYPAISPPSDISDKNFHPNRAVIKKL